MVSECGESFSVCASRHMLRADWLAGCRGEYKRDDDVRSSSLVGVAWEDDMTDWESDK